MRNHCVPRQAAAQRLHTMELKPTDTLYSLKPRYIRLSDSQAAAMSVFARGPLAAW